MITDSEIDISRLTNLRTLRLYGSKDTWEVEKELPNIQHVLSQIQSHMLHLEEIVILIYLEEEHHIDDLGILDGLLTGENFSRIKRVRIEMFPTPLFVFDPSNGRYNTYQKVRRQFPLLVERGILTVTHARREYPCVGVGIP